MATHKYTKQPIRYIINAYVGGQNADAVLAPKPTNLPRHTIGCWSADRALRSVAGSYDQPSFRSYQNVHKHIKDETPRC